MEKLFIALQHSLPQHWLSRALGRLARARRPALLRRWVIRRFIAHYGVDLGEAVSPPDGDFDSFNAFFTRALKPGARPEGEAPVLCPVDGTVSQLGRIDGHRVFQAKGQTFSLSELLGGDVDRGASYENGEFITLYLAPRDYHRVHMPVTGRLTATCYVPGRLFSVNAATARHVPRLFARNERLVCHFETGHGPMAVILVGAMIVAAIETAWSGLVVPTQRLPQTVDYLQPPPAVTLERGAELGRFLLGSTVIVLFPPGVVRWDPAYRSGRVTRCLEALAQWRESPGFQPAPRDSTIRQ